jgi:PAS domain S-box-containing protein
LGSLESVIGAMRSVESSARKYVITGEPADLMRYKSARTQVNSSSVGLDGSASDVVQQHRLRQLQAAMAERMERLDEVVRMRQNQGVAAATELVRSGRGEAVALRVQSLADQFRDYEQRTLRNRRNETEFSADATAYLVFWGLGFAMTLLMWAMVAIHRHQSGQRKAEEELKASEAQLRLITDAVPALIGYVDRGGKLRFHNRAFEYWFSRSKEELNQGTLPMLLGQAAYAKMAPHVAEVLAGKAVDFDLFLHGVRGTDMFLSVQLVPRRGSTGAVVGYYALATDITALKEVDRMKSEFVATVSHELRTPLTSIRGSLGLLASGITGVLPDKARELVNIAVQNCERLVRLVNDILDSEKMLSGKMDWTIRPLDLAELVQRSVRENEGYAAGHGVSIRLEITQAGTRVQADSDRLVQVITNLLSNACKFSPAGGVVEVSITRTGERLKVSVADRGAGVPRELQARLFERFAQLDSNDQRRRGGTGLGLSICRSIVEHMGGTIAFNERPGGGSIFFFELPASVDAVEKTEQA